MDKKQRLMAAAEGLFQTGQFQEITLDEVAELADVGKGTIYQYFASKDDLFFQTAIAAFEQVCELLRQKATTESSVEEHLQRACAAICKFGDEHRPLFRLIHAEGERALSKGGGLRQRWLQHRQKLTQAIAEIFRLGVERRQVRDDIAPEVLAEYFLALLRARGNELAGRADRERSQQTLVSLFVSGLAPRTTVKGRRRAAKRSLRAQKSH
jgi:TetR/AcrR family fatty acid metabolism transcriptional regulator